MQSSARHSGAMRKHRTMMCNCTSENLEIPGLVLTHHPGMTGPISAAKPGRHVLFGPGALFGRDRAPKTVAMLQSRSLGDDDRLALLGVHNIVGDAKL